ncbi:MAG TPA: hypothetical protein V6D43_06725 [Candidatus Sericytochromatia bacterium]
MNVVASCAVVMLSPSRETQTRRLRHKIGRARPQLRASGEGSHQAKEASIPLPSWRSHFTHL